jgi:hypothetical protein
MPDDQRPRIAEFKRPKFTGRGGGPTFVMLRHDMVRSREWQALSGNAVKLAIHLAQQYNGSNNGDLSMSKADLIDAGWNSHTTALKARDELVEAGFVVITRHGYKRVCNLYAVTWFAIDDCPEKRLEMAPTTRAPDYWKNRVLTPDSGNVAPVSGAKAA